MLGGLAGMGGDREGRAAAELEGEGGGGCEALPDLKALLAAV